MKLYRISCPTCGSDEILTQEFVDEHCRSSPEYGKILPLSCSLCGKNYEFDSSFLEEVQIRHYTNCPGCNRILFFSISDVSEYKNIVGHPDYCESCNSQFEITEIHSSYFEVFLE